MMTGSPACTRCAISAGCDIASGRDARSDKNGRDELTRPPHWTDFQAGLDAVAGRRGPAVFCAGDQWRRTPGAHRWPMSFEVAAGETLVLWAERSGPRR
jgi:hypothetical protein